MCTNPCVLLIDGVRIALVVCALVASKRGFSIMHRASGEEDNGVLVGRLGAKLWFLVREAVVVLLVDLVESVVL